MQDSAELVTKMKTRFYTNLYNKGSSYNSVLMTKRKYESMIDDVKRIKTSNKKESSRDYRIIEKYDVLTVQNCERLIEPLSLARGSVRQFVCAEELFDILYSTHLSISHGGRDKMIKQLNALYKNITQAQIKLFLELCELCKHKQKNEKKRQPITPVFSPNFKSRCKIDFIDYQSQPDGKCKFVLIYQDYLTKFVILKPLASKHADEVAYNLLDVFLLFGAPCILECDEGHEFCNQVLDCITQVWPELKMVYGESRCNPSQESAEQTNQDIKTMLATWMADNNTNKWSEGVRFIQFTKNRAYHSAIKKSPYEAMFGCPTKVGLSSILPESVLHSINNEEDLETSLQETAAMEYHSNLTPEVVLHPASAESPPIPSSDAVVNDIKSPCSSKESLEEVTIRLPPSLEDTATQFHSESTKSNVQDTVCIVCSKAASSAHTCKSCGMFVHVTCGEMETPEEEGYSKKVLCNICRKNLKLYASLNSS